MDICSSYKRLRKLNLNDLKDFRESDLLRLRKLIDDDIREIRSQDYEARVANAEEYSDARWFRRTMVSKKKQKKRVKMKLKKRL